MRILVPLSVAVLALTSLASINANAQAPAAAQTPPDGLEQLELLCRESHGQGHPRRRRPDLVATGMKDAGYIYVNIDDTWEGERDANGVLHTNSKFPDMKALADYVHSKGLKIGIYSGPGPKTCAGYAGSLGHEEQDAKIYADWGIDYLKYDLCSFIRGRDGEAGAQRQGRADAADDCRLRQDGQGAEGDRPADRVLALPVRLGCGVGVGAGAGRQPVAHHGRHYTATGTASTRSSSQQEGLEKYAGPGPLERSRHAGGGQRQAHRWRKTARTSPCGRCWPRRCWPATTCPT